MRRFTREDLAAQFFDNAWNPSDLLEDALGNIEGVAKPLFLKLLDSKSAVSASDREHLCAFLALQACRHPDIMQRGRRRLADLFALIALAQEFESEDEFVSEAIRDFGASESDARTLYAYLKSVTPELLRKGVESLTSMTELDPELPKQEVLRAQPQLEQILLQMQITILECPKSISFVLGDTPLPQEGLRHGFTVPLSKSFAVEVLPAGTAQTAIQRRPATVGEVAKINRVQWENSLHIVIGPDLKALKNL